MYRVGLVLFEMEVERERERESGWPRAAPSLPPSFAMPVREAAIHQMTPGSPDVACMSTARGNRKENEQKRRRRRLERGFPPPKFDFTASCFRVHFGTIRYVILKYCLISWEVACRVSPNQELEPCLILTKYNTTRVALKFFFFFFF